MRQYLLQDNGGATLTGIHVLPIFPMNLVGAFSVYRDYLAKKAIKFMENAKTMQQEMVLYLV